MCLPVTVVPGVNRVNQPKILTTVGTKDAEHYVLIGLLARFTGDSVVISVSVTTGTMLAGRYLVVDDGPLSEVVEGVGRHHITRGS